MGRCACISDYYIRISLLFMWPGSFSKIDVIWTRSSFFKTWLVFCELCSPPYYIISHNDFDTQFLDLDSNELFVFELLDTH